jgi:hypothetical protein
MQKDASGPFNFSQDGQRRQPATSADAPFSAEADSGSSAGGASAGSVAAKVQNGPDNAAPMNVAYNVNLIFSRLK